MTTQPVKQAPPRKDLAMILGESKDQIARALPKHLTPDRMLRICLTEIRKNPQLAQCDPYSFMGAVIQCAQLGLEPGSGLGHAYLVPFKREVNFIPGYKGLLDLARRSGQVKAINVFPVYPDDFLEEGVRGGAAYLEFKAKRPSGPRSDADMVAVLAIASFGYGESQWVVMERWEIDRIRDGLRYTSNVWKDHYVEMAKKTAIRRLCKLLPQSPEMVAVQEADDMVNDGKGQGNHRTLIDIGMLDANYEPSEPEPDLDKFRQVSAATDNAPPTPMAQMEAEKRKSEMDKVMMDFEDSVAAARGAGLDVNEVLKGAFQDVVMSMNPVKLRAAQAMLVKATRERTGSK